RLSCKRASKTRTLMPVWDSSGESRIKTFGAQIYKLAPRTDRSLITRLLRRQLGRIRVMEIKARLKLLACAMNARLRPIGFVLYSTRASVRARWPSVLAIVEIAAAVTLYWWVAIRFDTQQHLWVSVGAAWLLLLRSRQSVALGVKWFTGYIENDALFGMKTSM